MVSSSSSTIRPGILVCLKTTVSGGVQYQRVDLEKEQATEDGHAVSKWETTRVIDDPDEHERAIKARGRAVAEIRGVCAVTSFGLICPLDRQEKLSAALERAQALITQHNESASFTRIGLFVLKGQIASTDEEAARAISQEVSGLIAQMNEGINKLDPEAIREAATKAQSVLALLGDEKAEDVKSAINQARSAARTIVKRVQKEGQQASIVLADIQRGALEKARIAFLDLDGEQEVSGEAAPAVNVQRVAELEFAPSYEERQA
jgi:hypothetical protein